MISGGASLWPSLEQGVVEDLAPVRRRRGADLFMAGAAERDYYFTTLSLRPSAASVRLAPWVVLFILMTTPF